MDTTRRERLRAAAEAYAPGASARLVLPGTPSFLCLADQCGALCCRAPYRVDVDDAEASRLLPVTEIEEHGAIALLSQNDDGACALLTPDQRCGAYGLRPRGCVQYPYLLQFETQQGAGDTLPLEDRSAAVASWAGGGERDPAPLLMRDPACPGFVGPPLSDAEWAALLRWVWSLRSRPPPALHQSVDAHLFR